MVRGRTVFDHGRMETARNPTMWRAIGMGVPVTAAGMGTIGLWVDWFVLAAVAAVLVSLVGVHPTSPHRYERAFALTGLLVIGIPGLAVGFLFDPVGTGAFIGDALSDRTPT